VRYLKLALNWGPDGDRSTWGNHVDYFEIGPDDRAVRQINMHVHGPSLKYDRGHAADAYGFMADKPFPQGAYSLEPGDGEVTEISAAEFEALWARTEALNR
jgi:hypothetical protein